MQTMQLNEAQKETLEREISPLVQQATTIVVKDKDSRSIASLFADHLKDLRANIEERFHPTANKKLAYLAYEAALETEKVFYNPIIEAEKIIKASVKAFDTAESIKIQREAEVKAAEARRIEEEKQAKIQAKIDEENRKIEAARREEERIRAEKEAALKKIKDKELAEKMRREEEDRRAKQAAIDSENERKAQAKTEALQEKKEAVGMEMNFQPAPPPSKKLIWKAKVTNLFMLCKAVSSGQVPFIVVEVRQSALNDFAKGYDGKTKIEGLEFYQEAASRI